MKMGHYAKLRRKLSACANQQESAVTKDLVEAIKAKRAKKIEEILEGDEFRINWTDPEIRNSFKSVVRNPGYVVNQEIAILLIRHGAADHYNQRFHYLHDDDAIANADILEYLNELKCRRSLAALARTAIRAQLLRSGRVKNLAALVRRIDAIPDTLKQYLMLSRL